MRSLTAGRRRLALALRPHSDGHSGRQALCPQREEGKTGLSSHRMGSGAGSRAPSSGTLISICEQHLSPSVSACSRPGTAVMGCRGKVGRCLEGEGALDGPSPSSALHPCPQLFSV